MLTQTTLYEQVKTQIINELQNNIWTQGSTIPNELELAARYHVSQGTIRRALKELVNEGILIRLQGKGTFVASFSKNLDQMRQRINWFYPDDSNAGLPLARLISFETIRQASPKIAKLMNCFDEPIIHIRRELSYENFEHVSAFDDIYLKQKDFPTLSKDIFIAYQNKSPYSLYEEVFGLFVSEMHDVAKAVLLNPEQAKQAGVSLPYPAICLQRFSYTPDGKLVELRFVTNVTDNQHLLLRSASHRY